ncbi:hypothetical protein LTR91_013848 [Friedmanniomyces endolithicus]|uniref:Uncharacterized protein n=1 Tax=Friedmanniomyces endolithicus TaxID=329885 RepID=A0AAN6G0T3_9PEZI|nr:hypothetical protein LTS00_014366 [Friedmanniomyces endolithicus]KAK0328091.1 hypothetical protein LTR82_000018 [Friedmanniomyces endolithicus]KAK0909583.1 hypothetical protein LTR57_016293 [Friedmanniomyces endolithicus]KAK0975945.1 hypothetical protein LTR91_013848 [Friedmanniomyces endolithicus]KAK0979260.1 hypothetical protein LTS01_012483 [Friedmanniomyces endolithicus]
MQHLMPLRRLAAQRALRSRTVSPIQIRQFAASTTSQAGNTGNGNIVSDAGTQQDSSPGGETGGSREHALDKGNKGDPNVQSDASSSARRYVRSPDSEPVPQEHYATPFMNIRTGSEGFARRHEGGDEEIVYERTYADAVRSAKAQDSGGQAVREKDERNATAKAKKEHPEAPDVVIGMQDERGGKDWKKPEDAFPPAYHFHIAHLKHNALNTLDLEHNPLNMADLPQHADAIELGNLPPNAVPQQQPQALLDLEERERIVTYREAQIASKEALYRQFQLTVESRGHWSRWSAIVLGTLAYIASWVVILVWRNDLSVQCTRAHGLAAWSVNVGCQMIVLHQVCSFIFDGMAYTTDHNSKTRRFCIFVLNHLSITMLGITLMESIWVSAVCAAIN